RLSISAPDTSTGICALLFGPIGAGPSPAINQYDPGNTSRISNSPVEELYLLPCSMPADAPTSTSKKEASPACPRGETEAVPACGGRPVPASINRPRMRNLWFRERV